MIRICVQLADAALHHKELAVAERCYAALGDVAKARFIHKVPNHILHVKTCFSLLFIQFRGYNSALVVVTMWKTQECCKIFFISTNLCEMWKHDA